MEMKRVLCVIAAALPLSGCGLLPVEEQLPAAPVIQEYTQPEYEQVAVKRGDVISILNVSCSYVAVRTEDLSFSVDKVLYEGVYVNLGDAVKKGTLLAELDQGDVDKQIETLDYQLDVLKMKRDHINENWALELELLEAKQASQEKKDAVDEKYANQRKSIDDSIYIQNLRMNELTALRKQRQLIAGMDGVVSYVRTVQAGSQSVEGQVVVTISDMDSTAFVVYGQNASYFPVGTQTTIQCGTRLLQAVAVEPSALGLSEGEETAAYLRLVQPDPTLPAGELGTIQITKEAAYDVLYVEKKAVQQSDGDVYVYMLDGNGYKFRRSVTVGVTDGQYIQIVSGLVEGDSVIIE